jgi:murein L,D-transpeptidase YcbB/YkuD
MSWQYGILFNDAESFLAYLKDNLSSEITETHVHHTYSPSHAHFTGSNYKALQDGMRRYHVNARNFQDIAQHVTIFPDGRIMTGRNPNVPPASATGYNDSDNDKQHPFMFEMVGNFDIGHDKLQGPQLESAIKITKFLMNKGAKVRFHNQCLINGKSPKSCPGTSISYDWFIGLCDKQVDQSIPPKTPKSPTASKPVYKRLLRLTKPMMKGEDVRAVQKRLGVSSDGIFGPVTKNAVVLFQKKNKLLVDGIVGVNTWRKLFS